MTCQDSGQDSAVSFFKTANIDVSCGFSASFGFIINDVGSGTGDGLAFLMQATGPTVVGPYGEFLGYISAYTKGKVVAVEIDTYTSPAHSDSATPAVQVTVGYTEKTRCGIADPIGVETKYVWDYAAKVLSIYYSTDSTKPGSPCTTWSLDLPKYFGTPNLYLGFSAATGYFANNHYIAGVEFTY
ncbi:hypothetical protein OEZ86_005332 [Tetradesmus obliquus]|nr:hypothetical protein OEZ86_005332 [Tetradesmus obliquus]